MKFIYRNTHNLNKFVILRRLTELDPLISVETYSEVSILTDEHGTPNGLGPVPFIKVETSLSQNDILTALSSGATQSEIAAYTNFSGSAAAVRAIPNWATWTEAQALQWGTDNIGTPLAKGRANLPASLTLATAKTAILAILGVLDGMWAMQQAIIRMLIALRNKIF